MNGIKGCLVFVVALSFSCVMMHAVVENTAIQEAIANDYKAYKKNTQQYDFSTNNVIIPMLKDKEGQEKKVPEIIHNLLIGLSNETNVFNVKSDINEFFIRWIITSNDFRVSCVCYALSIALLIVYIHAINKDLWNATIDKLFLLLNDTHYANILDSLKTKFISTWLIESLNDLDYELPVTVSTESCNVGMAGITKGEEVVGFYKVFMHSDGKCSLKEHYKATFTQKTLNQYFKDREELVKYIAQLFPSGNSAEEDLNPKIKEVHLLSTKNRDLIAGLGVTPFIIAAGADFKGAPFMKKHKWKVYSGVGFVALALAGIACYVP